MKVKSRNLPKCCFIKYTKEGVLFYCRECSSIWMKPCVGLMNYGGHELLFLCLMKMLYSGKYNRMTRFIR